MAKATTTWFPDTGAGEINTGNEDIERLTEDGTTRQTEAGTTRVLEDAVYVPKASTTWTNSDS